MCLPECLLFTDIVYAAPPKPKIKPKVKPQQVLQLTYVKKLARTPSQLKMVDKKILSSAGSTFTYKPSNSVPAEPKITPPAFYPVPMLYTYYPILQSPAMYAYIPDAAATTAASPAEAVPVAPIAAFDPTTYTYRPTAAVAPKKPKGTFSDPYIWQGNSKNEIDRQNVVIAQNIGAAKQHPLIPHNATNTQQWWCKELDGSFTLRSTNTIMEELQPGFWSYAKNGRYPYWIRT